MRERRQARFESMSDEERAAMREKRQERKRMHREKQPRADKPQMDTDPQ